MKVQKHAKTNQNRLHRPVWYLIPLFLTIPVVAAAAFAVSRYGSQISDLMQIALKMVVVQ